MSGLSKQASLDLRAFTEEFIRNLKTTTPIRTGFARNSCKSPRGFWSSQAPRGIVEPALKKTKKK
jgi:hypothetical protein